MENITKLTYFPLMALGEPIRFMLSYLGRKFIDERIPLDEWPQRKPEMPFHQVPIMTENGTTIHQSRAICRYLGKQAGLNGSNDWEDLQIDIIIDTFQDFRLRFVKGIMENDEDLKKKERQFLLEEHIPYYFQKFDKIIEENDGYLANGKLSWVDLYIISYLETLETLIDDKNCLFDYKNLGKLRQRIYEIPNIANWLKTRAISQF